MTRDNDSRSASGATHDERSHVPLPEDAAKRGRKDDVVRRVQSYTPFQLPPGEARRAAVLVPLRPLGEGASPLEVILTRRSRDVISHAGQVSFPGGSIEPSDASCEAAALRETEEELGVPRGRVTVVGRLDDFYTVTGYHVAPVVGLVPAEIELKPNPVEVARVFAVPLDLLMQAERWEHRVHLYRGSEFLVWHFPYEGEDVWGATAAMLRGLVELLWR